MCYQKGKQTRYMSDFQGKVDVQVLKETIIGWLEVHLDENSIGWLTDQSEQLSKGAEDWKFFSSFSAVPRFTGKKLLNLSKEKLKKAKQLREGWTPKGWTVDQLGRTLLVLSISKDSKSEFLSRLEKAFISSDMNEAVALYQSLPLLPYPEELKKRASEGIRSNMTSVFNAVALNNPYPGEFFDDSAWNQLVLKALFVESPLYLIQRIDQRANANLAQMLLDYAHERWSANRTVSPELWRPIGPFIDETFIVDLKKVLTHPDIIHQQAAMLALSASPSPAAKALVEKNNKLAQNIIEQGITWDVIGRRLNKE